MLSLWGPAPRVPPSEAELMERRARGQLANQQSALHGLDMACRKHIGGCQRTPVCLCACHECEVGWKRGV